MYVYVVDYVMYVDLKPFKGVSTSDVIKNEPIKKSDYRYQNSAVPNKLYHDNSGGAGFQPTDAFDSGSYPHTKYQGRFGIDKFRVSWHMNIPPSGPLPCWGFLEEPFPLSTTTSTASLSSQYSELIPTPSFDSTAAAMVVAPKESNPVPVPIDRAAETVSVAARPGYQQTTVASELVYADNRRYKEQVDFRPVQHPIKYSDTAYVWINSTRRRFVSRTYYEPRVRPRAFSDTTYVRPKVAEQRFVSCLDIGADAKQKWFKTSIEIKPRKFTSSKVIRSPNNNYIGTDASSSTPNLLNGNGREDYDSYQNNEGNGSPVFDRLADDRVPNGGPDSESLTVNGFTERLDPGASQVYIPKHLKHPLDENCLINGDIHVNLLPNGHYMDR